MQVAPVTLPATRPVTTSPRRSITCAGFPSNLSAISRIAARSPSSARSISLAAILRKASGLLRSSIRSALLKGFSFHGSQSQSAVPSCPPISTNALLRPLILCQNLLWNFGSWATVRLLRQGCAVVVRDAHLMAERHDSQKRVSVRLPRPRQNPAASSARRRWAFSRAMRMGSAGPVVGPIGTNRTLLTPMKRSASRR
jgi:hypothetical protein